MKKTSLDIVVVTRPVVVVGQSYSGQGQPFGHNSSQKLENSQSYTCMKSFFLLFS